jgi:hypothetical protein
MLHAELAGKIAPDAHDITRREDVLTSTVFGTLFLTEAWPCLMRWMARAQPVQHKEKLAPMEGVVEARYWFWPRLDDAEPDVVIQCGTKLLVVEAKYLSGKSGGSVFEGATVVEASDQLVREWRACCPKAVVHSYPRDLCDAIGGCELHLIYLVRRARWARELRAVEESAAQIDGARFHLLTWEDLDDVLASHEARWARELRAYLHRRAVAAFRGFATTLGKPAPVEGWRYRAEPRHNSLQRALNSSHRDAATRLATLPGRFRRRMHSMAWGRIAAGLDPELLGGLAARTGVFSSGGRRWLSH